MSERLRYRIGISMARGICAPTLREMLDRIGDVENFFKFSQAELHNLVGFSSDIFAEDYRQSLLETAAKEEAFIEKNHINSYFLGDADYPIRLSNCEDAPVMLYTLGSCDLNNAHTIGIVGTRHATPYGTDFTTRLVNELVEKIGDVVIVSGLAYGIDVAAHKAALAAGVPTIGVLAHPLNTIYPADHRSIAAKMTSSGGALITEYTTDKRIHRSNFLARNRIVAGLCDCIVVVESDYKGGSMSTARTAMHYNRDVFAVPGRVNDTYSRGANMLIANHTASLLNNADDLIAQMGWAALTKKEEPNPPLFRALSVEEEELICYVKANPDCTINEISVRLGKKITAVKDTIFQMEMDDLIMTLPGGRLSLPSSL